MALHHFVQQRLVEFDPLPGGRLAIVGTVIQPAVTRGP